MFAVGFMRDKFQYIRKRIAADMQRIAVHVCLQKEMFSTAEKMMSSLKLL